jgi:hypothetical protein
LAATPTAPAQTLGHSETALKAAYNGQGWDASLLVFRGYNHLPEFELTSVTGTPPALTANVSQVFHRIKAMGGDGSYTAGAWIFRLETAYVWTENNDGSNPMIQPSRWDSVLGVERPLGDDFRIQLQGVYRYIPAFTDPALATQPQIAQANALLLGYQFKSRPGATFRVAYSNERNGIDAELFMVGNFVGGDYLIRPKGSYHWTESLTTTLGLDYYGGPADRPLGSLQPFNSLFLEAKYVF